MKMYDKIFNFKFLPPGRGLWAMGTAITEDKHLFAALNNCAFVSTKPEISEKNMQVEKFIESFTFLMDSAMIGIGIGFDTKGSHLGLKIYKPHDGGQEGAAPTSSRLPRVFTIEDSREGWVESLKVLLQSYLYEGQRAIIFDYSKIRQAGIPLKTFGGQSSGPAPLKHMHELI